MVSHDGGGVVGAWVALVRAAVPPMDGVGIRRSRRRARLAGVQVKDKWLTGNTDRGAGDASGRLHGHHRNARFRALDAGIEGVGSGDRLRAPRVQGGREGGVHAGVAAGEGVVRRQHGLGVGATEGHGPAIASGHVVVGIKGRDGEVIGRAGRDR